MPYLSRDVVPAGAFGHLQAPVPAVAKDTVSVRAQLLARSDLSDSLVEEFIAMLLDPRFLESNQLSELMAGGKEWARQRPGFSLHEGAQNHYEPGLKPLLNPEFVETTEGMRSFLVSIIVAAYLLVRATRNARLKRQEHRLDVYIHKLLDIERRQMPLDIALGESGLAKLEDMLDEVTLLRQEALRTFTAHQLQEDRGTECFISMCHALSDKIAGKLLRARIDGLTTLLSPDAGKA